MAVTLKEFITAQLQSESPGPGRFFTAHNGEFRYGDIDLLEQYDTLLKSIGDGKPSPQAVQTLFDKIGAAVDEAIEQIKQENPGIPIKDEAPGDIKFSMVFKFPGFLLKTKPAQANEEDEQAVLKQYLSLNGQSPVLTNLAKLYFTKDKKAIAENTERFFEKMLDGRKNYYQGRALHSDAVSKEALISDLALGSDGNFLALPKDFQERVQEDLWIMSQAAKNPCPLSIDNFVQPMFVSTLAKIKSASVDS